MSSNCFPCHLTLTNTYNTMDSVDSVLVMLLCQSIIELVWWLGKSLPTGFALILVCVTRSSTFKAIELTASIMPILFAHASSVSWPADQAISKLNPFRNTPSQYHHNKTIDHMRRFHTLLNCSQWFHLKQTTHRFRNYVGRIWLPGKWSGSSKVGFVSSRLLESFHMTNCISKWSIFR